MDIIAQELYNVPPVTRVYILTCFAVTTFVQLGFLSPFQLYFNTKLIFRRLQLWRLVTCFCFFGPMDFNFFFNMLFIYRYCRWLEENWYRRKASEFILLFLFCGVLSVICASFLHILFLSQILTMMLVYVWSRRNPLVVLEIFGILTVQAPYLPWVFFGLSYLLGNNAMGDFLGIAIGHLYYFLEDVYPHQENGFKVLVVPQCIKQYIDGNADDADYEPLPEENQAQPGGFNWADGDH